MLVHFPIVLFLAAVALDAWIVKGGGNLAERGGLPMVATIALVAGTVFAALAAGFGDLALDHAIDVGFPTAPLEEHEELGFATLYTFLGLVAVRLLSIWRGVPLSGRRGILVLVLGTVGLGILISTGYHGGHLVYDLGVNVATTPL